MTPPTRPGSARAPREALACPYPLTTAPAASTTSPAAQAPTTSRTTSSTTAGTATTSTATTWAPATTVCVVESLRPHLTSVMLFAVSVHCKDTRIVVNVGTNKPFSGRIYALGRSETCNVDVINSDTFRLDLTMAGQDCNTQSAVSRMNRYISIYLHTFYKYLQNIIDKLKYASFIYYIRKHSFVLTYFSRCVRAECTPTRWWYRGTAW